MSVVSPVHHSFHSLLPPSIDPLLLSPLPCEQLRGRHRIALQGEARIFGAARGPLNTDGWTEEQRQKIDAEKKYILVRCGNAQQRAGLYFSVRFHVGIYSGLLFFL